MREINTGLHPMEDPKGHLERAFIEEYLRRLGHGPEYLHRLAPEQAQALLIAASTHAAGRLAEFEARAHYLHDIHQKDQ
jgi:hypothetical protein